MLLFLSGPGRHPLPFLDGGQHAPSWPEPRLSEQVARGSGSLRAPHGLVLGPAPQDTAIPFYLYKHGGFGAACSNPSKGWGRFSPTLETNIWDILLVLYSLRQT